MSKPTVLIVEDEHALASALGASVTRLGATPKYAASGSKAIAALSERAPAAVVLDIGLPDMSGLEVLKRSFPDGVTVPVLVVTAHGNLENAIAAKRLGVAEYLTKPLDLHAFEEVLSGLLSAPVLVEGGNTEPERGTTMIGASPAMQRVFTEVAHACTTGAPVLIAGPSGSGKTLAARVIHANSDAPGDLRALECGDIDAHSIGDFLSANEGDAGTVLFENVDRLPAGAQSAVLAAVESGLQKRLLSTTRISLHDAVSSGDFREDLYYRLRGIEIRLPSLAERVEDIPALAAYFLGQARTSRALAFSEEALDALCEREWKGNVWELRNAVDYGASACGGSRLLPQHLPPVSAGSDGRAGGLEGALGRWLEARLSDHEGSPNYSDLLDEVEGVLLSKLLKRFGGKPTHLATELGLNRTTLRKRLERLGIR